MSGGWCCDKCEDTDGECNCCTCCTTLICKNMFHQGWYSATLINKNTAMMVCRSVENNDLIMAHINGVVPSEGYLDFVHDNTTLLNEACFNGNYDLANFLIVKGADVNLNDDYDNTALHRACEKCHLKIVKLLLDNRAEKNVMNASGETPKDLVSCCEDPDKQEDKAAIIELLNKY